MRMCQEWVASGLPDLSALFDDDAMTLTAADVGATCRRRASDVAEPLMDDMAMPPEEDFGCLIPARVLDQEGLRLQLWDDLAQAAGGEPQCRVESLEEFCEDESYKLAPEADTNTADTEDRLLFIDEVEVLTEKKRESGITCSTEEEELGFEELGVIEVDDGDDLIDDARLKPMEVVGSADLVELGRQTVGPTDSKLRQNRPSDLDPKAYRKSQRASWRQGGYGALFFRPTTPPAARSSKAPCDTADVEERTEYVPPRARGMVRPKNHARPSGSTMRYLRSESGSRSMYEVEMERLGIKQMITWKKMNRLLNQDQMGTHSQKGNKLFSQKGNKQAQQHLDGMMMRTTAFLMMTRAPQVTRQMETSLHPARHQRLIQMQQVSSQGRMLMRQEMIGLRPMRPTQ
jgi:hypothetical protein